MKTGIHLFLFLFINVKCTGKKMLLICVAALFPMHCLFNFTGRYFTIYLKKKTRSELGKANGEC